MEQVGVGQPDSEWWRDPENVYQWWLGFCDVLNATNPDHPDYMPGLEIESDVSAMDEEEQERFLKEYFSKRFEED